MEPPTEYSNAEKISIPFVDNDLSSFPRRCSLLSLKKLISKKGIQLCETTKLTRNKRLETKVIVYKGSIYFLTIVVKVAAAIW